jgi:hypothetical protein
MPEGQEPTPEGLEPTEMTHDELVVEASRLKRELVERETEIHGLRETNRLVTAEAAGVKYGLPAEVIERLRTVPRDQIETEAAFYARNLGASPPPPGPSTTAPPVAPVELSPQAAEAAAQTTVFGLEQTVDALKVKAMAERRAERARQGAALDTPEVRAKIAATTDQRELDRLVAQLRGDR